VTDQESFQPVITGLHIIGQIKRMYPSDFILRSRPFKRLMGSTEVYDLLLNLESPSRIGINWQKDLDWFKFRASRYFLYPWTDDTDG
ncbi:MAG: DUF1343 domain-containing protein, partial [Ignavibacteria bacterium]|nr:DUF1343 domain-containing protein [Ignavibacteria bacterium]